MTELIYPGQRVVIRTTFDDDVDDLTFTFIGPDGTETTGTPDLEDGVYLSSVVVDRDGTWRYRIAGGEFNGEVADEGRFYVQRSLIPPAE